MEAVYSGDRHNTGVTSDCETYAGSSINLSAIYAFGGYAATTSTTSSVYKYTPSSTGGSWSQVASLPTPTDLLAAATDSSGNIYAIGGQTNTSSASATVYKYTPSSTGGSWSQVASLPTPKAYLAAAGSSIPEFPFAMIPLVIAFMSLLIFSRVKSKF